jgi:hypothetical protein
MKVQDKDLIVQGGGGVRTAADQDLLERQMKIAIESKLLPRGITHPAQAIMIAMKGRELGIEPLHALSHIHIIEGKPTASSELMMGLIFKNCRSAIVQFVRSDAQVCELKVARERGGPASVFKFTIEDAQRAGVANKDNWRKYPDAMLRARAISAMARAMFPDAIMGCSYTPEEMGAVVNEEGAPVDVAPAPVRVSEPAKPTQQELDAIAATAKKFFEPEVGQSLGDYVITFGAHKGKRLKDMPVIQLEKYSKWLQDEAKKTGRGLGNHAHDFVRAADEYFKELANDNIPY